MAGTSRLLKNSFGCYIARHRLKGASDARSEGSPAAAVLFDQRRVPDSCGPSVASVETEDRSDSGVVGCAIGGGLQPDRTPKRAAGEGPQGPLADVAVYHSERTATVRAN